MKDYINNIIKPKLQGDGGEIDFVSYEDGILIKAETRGNGYVGSDITEHIKRFKIFNF